MRIDGTDLDVAIDGARILHRVSVHAAPGTFVGLIGPNGSGKSTLLRVLSRTVRPSVGIVAVGGADLAQLPGRVAARRISVLHQNEQAGFEFAVREIVALGRLPHQRLFARESSTDHAVIADCLQRCGVADLADRQFASLSGGERQRVLIARALAQQPRVMLLDEPTNHLDIGSQLDLLGFIASLGITTVAALHDLNQAAAHCGAVVVLRDGRVVAAGPTETTLTESLVSAVYGVQVRRDSNPITGRAHFAFAAASGPTDTAASSSSVHALPTQQERELRS